MPSDISLSASIRETLGSLKQTSRLMSRTQERLATGKAVNSAADDPFKWFAAQARMSRAADLDRLKANLSEAVQTIKAADRGITGVTKLLEEARSLVDAARSTTPEARAALAGQFNTLVAQMKDLVADATYNGVNLLANQSLTVAFEGMHNLVVAGIDAANGNGYLSNLGDAASNYGNFNSDSDLSNAMNDLSDVLGKFRTASVTLATNLPVIATRQDFTVNMIDMLETGAEQLTEADQNEEAANMIMLQTRQQLSISSLRIASEASQAILKLL